MPSKRRRNKTQTSNSPPSLIELNKKFTILVTSILLCVVVGNLAVPITISALPVWYIFLNKASFTPPVWVFGPVWIFLYTLMGIALYGVWEKRTQKNKLGVPLKLFGIQLTLNLLWSIVFFGLKSPLLGLITIMLLWVSIIATMLSFWKVSRNATLFLVPYLIWVSFAVILNFYIWFLN